MKTPTQNTCKTSDYSVRNCWLALAFASGLVASGFVGSWLVMVLVGLS